MSLIRSFLNNVVNFWAALAKQRPAVYGSAYFLAIPAFALFYIIIQGFNVENLSIFDAVYFSVVTITTLGYGDIQPEMTHTRLAASFEAVFGVLMIGLFLSSLAHTRATEQAKEEARKVVLDRVQESALRIKMQMVLLSYKFDMYFANSDHLCTTRADNPRIFRPGFPIQNFIEMFQPGYRLDTAFDKTKLEAYVDSYYELKSALEHLLITVDFSYWPQLQTKIAQWIETTRNLDRSQSLLGKPRLRLGNRSMVQADMEMIAKFQGEIRVQGSNAMDDYCFLYLQISFAYPLAKEIKEDLANVRVETANLS